jgi:hypothetical protein
MRLQLQSASLLILLALCASPSRAGSVLGDDFNQDEDHDYNGMPKLRIALGIGYSHWFHDPDFLYAAYERYLQKIENGSTYSAQAVWFPWAQGGLGGEWIWFLSKSTGEGVRLKEGDTGHSLRDRASFVYYGPTFMSRVQFGRFGMLTAAFGAGILFADYSFSVDGNSGWQSGRNYALVPQVGWEYSFYRLLSMGINARGILSNLTEYTQNGEKVTLKQTEDFRPQINMYRFEVNAAVIFGL